MSSFLNSRVLKINVGFLLHDGPAHSQDSKLDIPAVKVADDLIFDYVRGPIRLSRTTEGILVQANLHIGIKAECYRCLDEVNHDVEVTIEELFTHHSQANLEFSIDDDAILDLGPLLRAEVLIAASYGVLCKPDCKGLCQECGTNLNHETCECSQKPIDPRFAKLKELLDSGS
ncbi:MAG TPA: DUF177 domain-containing protein [Aggregatilineales bacterium]|nr:DUF177 domain-containing protein [Aggregatilineales bacterium]